MGADLRGAWSSRAATSQDLAGDRVHDNPADRRIGGVRRLEPLELEHEPNIPEIQATVAASTDALGRGALPLRTAVVRPDVLALVDPDAAAALPPLEPGDRLRPVTYVRGLVLQFEGLQPPHATDTAIGWIVVRLTVACGRVAYIAD